MNPINADIYAVAPIRCFKKEEEIGQATGFFCLFNWPYFITNRHVVIDEGEEFYPDELRLLLHKRDNTRRNEMLSLPLYDANGKKLWLEHPLHGNEVDVIAIPIDPEKLDRYALKYFSTRDFGLSIDLSIGDDVLVIGYPLGFRDTVHNYPIVRNATIASVYPAPFEGKPRFLIDSRLHRGTSGSPVLTKPTDIIRTTDGSVAYQPGLLRRYFLGIHSETLDIPDRDPQIDEPLGLNFVWYAGLIPEIIKG
jgi:S1-C subfamily serine protease